MNFPKKPQYSKSFIDRAGIVACQSAVSSQQYEQSISTINAWRISHEYPMQTFNVTLRRKAQQISEKAIVARRLKRMVTILDKISNREEDMRLSRMQDIGGVRAIMQSIRQVEHLAHAYLHNKRFPHILKCHHDYITTPKSSGYRGIHLVYQFNNSQGRQSDSREWDGLLIEIQLRTELQHAWATSVEIAGTMRHENLKSSRGNHEWLAFFELMSSVIAQLEDQPVLPQHSSWDTRRLYRETYAAINRLDAHDTMRGWIRGMRWINERETSYYSILRLDIKEKSVYVTPFARNELEKANTYLELLEKEAVINNGPQPVLVAAGDLKNLKKAYPNYALDSHRFLEIVAMVVETVRTAV